MTGFPRTKTDGSPTLGCTLGFGTPYSAQILSRIGYDFVLIDMEHNPLSAREAGVMTQAVVAASAGGCQAIIRVPSQGVEWIKWALDCGAAGIFVPMVESVAEMENVIQHATYPPRGRRSFGPALAVFTDQDPTATSESYLRITSPYISVIPMIESVVGLAHLEEICGMDGVTSVFVGPVDLRLSMGLPGGDGTESIYLDALRKVVATCKRFKKPAGIFATDAKSCGRRMSEGFTYLLVGSFVHRSSDPK